MGNSLALSSIARAALLLEELSTLETLPQRYPSVNASLPTEGTITETRSIKPEGRTISHSAASTTRSTAQMIATIHLWHRPHLLMTE